MLEAGQTPNTTPRRSTLTKATAKKIITPTKPTKPQNFSHFTTFSLIRSIRGRLRLLIRHLSPHATINMPTVTTHIIFLNDKLALLRRLYDSLLLHLAQFHTDILDAHYSRQRQLTDYQNKYTTPLTSRYAETQHNDTNDTLQHTLHKTTSLADSINTPHHFLSIHTKYDSWIQHLPQLYLPTNEATHMIHRRYHILHKSLKRANRIHKQLQQSLCTALGRQRNKVIDHKLNINLLSDACHMVHPTQRTPPQLCATTTNPQAPGLPPLTTYATTIPTQLTTTRDTYIRQRGPSPGVSVLFYATRTKDDAGTNGVTIHPKRTFQAQHLSNYHPLAHLFDPSTKQRVIQAHHTLKHIYAPIQPHNALS